MYEAVEDSKQVEVVEKPLCEHCGDQCPDHSITIEQKYFCCEGCKMVFSILHEYNLTNFYQLNDNAGFSLKNKTNAEYNYLDEPEVISKLIDFSNDEITKVHFYLPQIHCSSCLWLLENLQNINSAIVQVRVNFVKKEIYITFNHIQTSLRQVVELLDKIGYRPVIQLSELESSKTSTSDKSIYYKLGLAGFAFGNIMLLSFPEYLGLEKGGDHLFNVVFGYLNILLIIPVIVYSGQDYLRNAWLGLSQKHLNIDVPISLGILALFLRSCYEIISQTGAGYLDSLAGLVFFLLIGKWFQQVTYTKISFDRDYKSYFPIAAKIATTEGERQITLDKLKKGDRLIIRHGELIPADGILLSDSASIDYSFVSGEAACKEKIQGETMFAGGRQMGGLIEIAVTKIVSNSYLTHLWNDHAFTKSNKKGEASALANKVAKFFTISILLIAFTTLIYWLVNDSTIAAKSFTAVLIVACPCAVALSIPFTFGNVLRLLARRGIFLKNVYVIESLANAEQVVFDKTGTITNTLNSEIIFEGEELSTNEKQWIKSLAYHSTHPKSQKIYHHYANEKLLSIQYFREIEGLGLSGLVDGRELKIGSKAFILNSNHSDLLYSSKATYVSIDGNVVGCFVIHSSYREGLNKVLSKLKKKYRLSILSGDNSSEKEAISKQFPEFEKLIFNNSPVDKLHYIKSAQKVGLKTVMIGDGLNDAGALKQSNVGIVLTENASNFTPACDIIMEASNFEKLPELFQFAKQSIRIVYISYCIALLYNIIGLSFAVQGALSPVIAAILMPLSSISIVLFGVGASTLLAWRYKLFSDDGNHDDR